MRIKQESMDLKELVKLFYQNKQEKKRTEQGYEVHMLKKEK